MAAIYRHQFITTVYSDSPDDTAIIKALDAIHVSTAAHVCQADSRRVANELLAAKVVDYPVLRAGESHTKLFQRIDAWHDGPAEDAIERLRNGEHDYKA